PLAPPLHLPPSPTLRSSVLEPHLPHAAPLPLFHPPVRLSQGDGAAHSQHLSVEKAPPAGVAHGSGGSCYSAVRLPGVLPEHRCRSEEHTSELQSRFDLVCRL